MNDAKQIVINEFRESSRLKNNLVNNDEILKIVVSVSSAIINAFKKNKKVLLFGNGGSAADAQHIAAELIGKYRLHRTGLAAVALNTNTSTLTALANDYSFTDVFTRQLDVLGQRGDVAIGISTSGKSKNVISALKLANQKRLITVALTGTGGRGLKKHVNYCICVPSADTPRIQEAHILIGHTICEIVEKTLFGKNSAR
ncbi:MAG: D-sedoheptulose 7-phosphate isomerase [bacterium]